MRIFLVSLYTGFFGLFLISFLAGFDQADAEELPVRERLISIDMQSQDFTQALEAIANQAGITINVHGQIPEGKRDLSMSQLPMGQAMAQVLRMYGVRNHAAAYNAETGTVMLAILETSTMVAALSPETEPKMDFWDKPLTEDQLARLREQSEIIVAQMEESMRPLTTEQLDRLREQSAEIEAEMEEVSQPLTEEQMERLREQSFWIELEMEEASQPLTPDQMERLREQSRSRIQDEEERTSQPLTEDQLRRLREQGQQLQ